MSENDLKKKSGVIYLAVFLFAVCAVATVLMATAKYLTDPTIAKAEQAKKFLPEHCTIGAIAVVNLWQYIVQHCRQHCLKVNFSDTKKGLLPGHWRAAKDDLNLLPAVRFFLMK